MDLAELRSLDLLELLDVELARALTRAAGSSDPEVALAIALTSRNVRRGHTCFPLGTHAAELWPREATRPDALPEAEHWAEVLRKSALTQDGPLILDDEARLYLRRYWQLENDIAANLRARDADAPSQSVGRANCSYLHHSDRSWSLLHRIFALVRLHDSCSTFVEGLRGP